MILWNQHWTSRVWVRFFTPLSSRVVKYKLLHLNKDKSVFNSSENTPTSFCIFLSLLSTPLIDTYLLGRNHLPQPVYDLLAACQIGSAVRQAAQEPRDSWASECPPGDFSSCPSRVPACGGMARQWPDAPGSLPRLTLLDTAKGITEHCGKKEGRLKKHLLIFHNFCCASFSWRKPSTQSHFCFPTWLTDCMHWRHPGQKAGDLPNFPILPSLFSHSAAFILFSFYLQ